MIALRAVGKRFGTRRALWPLSLEVAPGEVVALIGPNGAGKSTALRILAGVLHADEGTAAIAGHDVAREPEAARRALGYLPQKLGVPLTTGVADLGALVAAARGLPPQEAFEALRAARLGDRLGATLGELSGGERQRALLALATLGAVSALVLDEPSISLDADGAEDVRVAIRDARRRDVGVLFASHHLSDVAALADRIVVLVDGRAVATGSLGDLAAAAGVSWSADAVEAPLERIYRVLVQRSRGAVAGALGLVTGEAA
jgi:ABC-2 type transport system ATP-binding protein